MAAARNLIITGAGRGIGAACAERAARLGYAVCVNCVNNDAAAAAVVAAITAAGGRARAIKADVAEPAQVERLFDEAAAAFGPVTHLVNNAGVPGRIGRVENLDPAVLRRTFDVNVHAAIFCAQAFVRRASTRRGGAGGAIVNVPSMASRTGSPGELVHYAAAKAALETVNYGLASEVATEGIRVNAVACGLIETGIHAEAGDASRLERYATRMPMQRAGRPMEVAQATAPSTRPSSRCPRRRRWRPHRPAVPVVRRRGHADRHGAARRRQCAPGLIDQHAPRRHAALHATLV